MKSNADLATGIECDMELYYGMSAKSITLPCIPFAPF